MAKTDPCGELQRQGFTTFRAKRDIQARIRAQGLNSPWRSPTLLQLLTWSTIFNKTVLKAPEWRELLSVLLQDAQVPESLACLNLTLEAPRDLGWLHVRPPQPPWAKTWTRQGVGLWHVDGSAPFDGPSRKGPVMLVTLSEEGKTDLRPGSHHCVKWLISWVSPRFIGKGLLAWLFLFCWQAAKEPHVTWEGSLGDILVLDPLLLHRSAPNSASLPRYLANTWLRIAS